MNRQPMLFRPPSARPYVRATTWRRWAVWAYDRTLNLWCIETLASTWTEAIQYANDMAGKIHIDHLVAAARRGNE